MKVWIYWIVLVSPLAGQMTINSMNPSSVDPGSNQVEITFTLPGNTPPTPPLEIAPDSVTIGSVTGTDVQRSSVETLTAVFDFPVGMEEGTQIASVTFTTPHGEISFTSSTFVVGEATTADPGAEWTNGPPAAGYNLFCPINSFETRLTDLDGNTLNTWTSEYRAGNALYLSEDGSLYRLGKTDSSYFAAGGAGGVVERFDWDGNLTWSFRYDSELYRLHHDMELLPNGNLLLVAWEKKTGAEAVAAGRDPELLADGEIWPDHIIEIRPFGDSGAEIIWEWHVWDHLVQDRDSSLPGFGIPSSNPRKIDINHTQTGQAKGGADWNHINSIDYNPETDHILLSVRNFSELWIIDHGISSEEAAGPAGDLLYRTGNPVAFGGGDSTDQSLFVQHDAQWITGELSGAGHILLFNNGDGRPEGDFSSVDELLLPMEEDGGYQMGEQAEVVWSYTSANPTDFYASHISGAQRLRNGNTLITDGTARRAFEVTSDGELVWEDDSATGDLFRYNRLSPDYSGFAKTPLALPDWAYAIVDTGQTGFYDDTIAVEEPLPGEPFYGQDGNYEGNQPTYDISPDGLTVYDYNTGLTWTRSHDWNSDGLLNVSDKMTQSEAESYAAQINAGHFGGYSDWRLPSIKELYSLMDFRGTDPNVSALDTSGLEPFIDDTYFLIGYGDTNASERIIDSQFATTTIYVDTVMNNQEAMFGLNLVDGRIKGYPTVGKTYYVFYCRGNTDYGHNAFLDNTDGTVTDIATGLMWAQSDSGYGMEWEEALAYAEASELGGYSDWRLPNTKELQSLVDYSRSPGTTGSPAIDPVFSATAITNMAQEIDYPWYWAGTTHLKYTGAANSGSYVCFGRGTGTMDGTTIIDVHGAGSQRSDPKSGNAADYPSSGHGPQGDVQRVYNYVRLVRDAEEVSWMYDESAAQDGLGMGWLWTSSSAFPWYFRAGDTAWLWRYVDDATGDVYFYNGSSGSWE